VRTVREECLDHILVINEAHLRRIPSEYLEYFNAHRPHQGLEQQSPIPRAKPLTSGIVNRRKVLGGIINDYFRASDKTSICPTKSDFTPYPILFTGQGSFGTAVIEKVAV